jgi:hypothetical protein
MGKYSSKVQRKELTQADKTPHAVWRGIGCLMILIIPIVSIALAIVTVNYGLRAEWTIPYQLLGYPRMADIFTDVRFLRQLTLPIRQTENFYAYSAFTTLYMILIGGFISVLYALVYRMIGPSRYGPFDAPPPKIKTKKYTR